LPPTPPAPAPAADRRGSPDARGPDLPLQYVKGIGPERAKLLGRLGLETVEDALYRLPARHEDRSHLVPLRSITPGPARTASGTVAGVSPPPRGRPRVPLEVLLRDGSGFLKAIWFNQPYLARVFQRGQRLVVHGKVQRYGAGPLQMQVKDYEIAEEGPEEAVHTGRLVPVYDLTQGLTQRPMRSLMKRLVDGYAARVDEPLPDGLRARRRLPGVAAALAAGHFPDSPDDLAAARRRLAFEDFFLLQVGLAIRRHREGR